MSAGLARSRTHETNPEPTMGDDGISDGVPWPDELQANAWTGAGAARGGVAKTAERVVLGARLVPSGRFLRPVPVDNRLWADPRVGWGLVLAEKPGLSP